MTPLGDRGSSQLTTTEEGDVSNVSDDELMTPGSVNWKKMCLCIIGGDGE